MNYYKHHLGDYAKDTPHLTIVEHGAYRVLMDACYIAEKPLPLDMGRLYAIVRAARPAERKVVDSVLAEFFIKDETGYHHKRIDEELEKYREKASQNKSNGNLGGRPKITQTVIKQEPKNNLSHKPVTNNQEPVTKNQELQTPKTKVKNNGADAPDWMPSVWADFEKHRTEKRQTFTPTARTAAIAKLDRWRQEGKDIAAIIQNSLENGYTGLFEINNKNQSNQDSFDAAERQIFGEAERDITHDAERV